MRVDDAQAILDELSKVVVKLSFKERAAYESVKLRVAKKEELSKIEGLFLQELYCRSMGGGTYQRKHYT